MSARHDLVPLTTVKKWSKTLSKIWIDIGGGHKPSLSTSQEAMARVLGYTNWQHLLTSYDGYKQEENNASLATFGTKGIFPTFVTLTTTGSNGPNFVGFWDEVFSFIVKEQYRGLYILVANETAKIYVKQRNGKMTLAQETSEENFLNYARVLFNVLLNPENKELTFDSNRMQQSFWRHVFHQTPCLMFYQSTPLGEKSFSVHCDVLPFDEHSSTFVADLLIPKGIPEALSCSGVAHKSLLVSQLIRGFTKQQKKVVVISDCVLPLNTNPNTTVISVPVSWNHSSEKIMRGIEQGRFLLNTEDFDVFIINSPLEATHFKKVSLPTDKPVFYMVNETHHEEFTRNLMQEGVRMKTGFTRFSQKQGENMASTRVVVDTQTDLSRAKNKVG